MSRARPLLYGLGGLLAAGAVVLLVVAWSWLPSQEEVATRAATAFRERTGVQVDFAHVRWTLWPQPTLVIDNAVTRQASPIVVKSLRLQGTWSSLLRRQPQLDEVHLDGAVVPQDSLRQLRAPDGGKEDAKPALDALPGNLRLSFRELTWIDRRAIELDYEGSINLDADGLPQNARIMRSGSSPPTQLRLEREGSEPRWRVLVDVPGGTWNGQARLDRTPKGLYKLSAELEPKNVEVDALLGVFHRRSAVAGRMNGKTTLSAEAGTPAGLLRSLHTTTHFMLKPARLTRFDLMKTVRSAGASDSGQTPLDELSGVLDTQNTPNGMEFRYSKLSARSGVLSASGNVRLLRRKLDGELAIDLVDGVVGIPLKVSGTVDKPELSMTGGALTGAAVGTAVLPGVGTAIGARIGQQVERLFGGDEKPGAPKASGQSPATPARPAR
ncbi:hypothetical protein [Variovorax sp. OV329]|uniref:hypothetical protein n=1 Tax=Variovorax sp. OV329 TaxID=1882825 RepID=UPI0008E930BA|nr:hypothetical protein [Variovorax sp. OV329]SFM28617.1 hypothetical protein SAMN05444747_10484 [Variovorax sp. OV329]